jgi:hypothetical protein
MSNDLLNPPRPQEADTETHEWPDPGFRRDEEGRPSPSPRGNQDPDRGDLERGQEKLSAVLGW